MKIECLTQREGVTPVSIGGVNYLFHPIPTFAKAKDGSLTAVDVTTSMCDVQSEEHVKYLLRQPNFKEYKDDGKPRIVDLPVNKLAGFGIEKCGEAGYMIVDRRQKPFRYCGGDGIWKDRQNEVKAFNSQLDAAGWLQEQAEMGDLPEIAEKPEKKKEQG